MFKLATLLLTLLLLVGCSKKEEPQLRIALVDWIGYAPLYIADFMGYLPKNARLVFFPSNYDIVEALGYIEIESAALTLDELLAHPKLPELAIIFAIDYSNGADAILSKKSDPFKGAIVAYEPQSVQEYLLRRALKEHNLSFADIHPYPLKYHLILDHADRVDTAVVFEPTKSKLEQRGFRTIFDSSQIPMEIVDLFVVQQKYLHLYPKTLRKIYIAYLKGIAFMQRYPQKSAQIVARYLRSDPQKVEQMLRGIKLLDNQGNCRFIESYDSIAAKVRHFTHTSIEVPLYPVMECRL